MSFLQFTTLVGEDNMLATDTISTLTASILSQFAAEWGDLIDIFCPFRAVTMFLDHEVSALVVHIFGTDFLTACALMKLITRSVLILKHMFTVNWTPARLLPGLWFTIICDFVRVINNNYVMLCY